MSSTSTPPPVPHATPPVRKKPSTLASCILLGMILGVVGVIGGGGFWAYRTFVAKPQSDPSPAPSVVVDPVSPTEPESPAPPAVAESPGTPPVVESPTQPSLLAATVDPEPPVPGPDPASEPTAATAESTPEPGRPQESMPAEPVAEVTPDSIQEPLPEPGVIPDLSDPDPMVAEQPVESFAEDSPQVVALKADADKRIDEAPGDLYSEADKQRVRDAVRKAKRLTRVATLQFGTGSVSLGSRERARLRKALMTSEAETLLSDPQAVFFILGFADSTGGTELNRRISRQRAIGVADVLKGFKVSNASYSVGIGSTTLLSADQESKNRAAEVWIVLP